MPRLVDHTGRPWELGAQVAAGGEGIVYSLAGEAGLVAKLYKQPPSAQTVEKLRRMILVSSPALLKVAAWPSALLHEGAGGPLVGFVMPRFENYQPIHHLYNPAQRIKHFPLANWAFLVHAARNCAAAFEEVHRAGCLVGDVNQSNMLVASRATVGLIDCDSFQVRSNGNLYLCEVGVPIYTPPELQGQPYRGLVRTANHDRFGLALLIFQLLFMGRHPYAGRYLGAGELPFEQAIKEYRFAYGRSAAAMQMERPPRTLSLGELSTELAGFFERAFAEGSEATDARPTATEWTAALDRFRLHLRPCPAEEGHVFPADRGSCPWCAIAAAGGPNHFRGVTQVATAFAADLARLNALWDRIVGIAAPAFDHDPSHYLTEDMPDPEPIPEDASFHRLYGRILGTNVLVGLALVIGSIFWGPLGLFGRTFLLVFLPWWLFHSVNSPHAREFRARYRARLQTTAALNAVEQRWQTIAEDYRVHLHGSRQRLESTRAECQRLDARFALERKQLESNKEALARDEFLKTQFLVDADIPKVGPGRRQMLASYGVETAFDLEVEAIRAIKGFGDALTRNLMDWKRSRLATFRFDSKGAVPEAEVRALVARFQHEQATLFARLKEGAEQLQALVAQTNLERNALEPELRRLAGAWAQAQANYEVFRR